MAETSLHLLERVGDRDERAAEAVYHRYAARLDALVRARTSPALRRRFDADDVLQSAYARFFTAAESGKFRWRRPGDLWRTLAAVTLNVLRRRIRDHHAGRRNARREVENRGSDLPASESGNTPAAAVDLADFLSAFSAALQPDERRALELRLGGRSTGEIAADLNRPERTVRRLLDAVRKRLNAHRLDSALPVGRVHGRTGTLPRVTYDDVLIERHLATGATGRVYVATNRRTNQAVAVKFLKKALLKRPEVVSRFLQEAEIVSRLDHPRVVPVRALGTDGSRVRFLVADYFPRGDLAQIVGSRPVPVHDALRWTADVANAIQFAHDAGVLHCDLKPGNVLLADDGSAAVTDFGLACAVGDSRSAGGTPAYMAPEQLDAASRIGPRTDVFGLGGLLCTLLTGQPPRDATRGVTNLPLLERDNVPAPIAQLCRRCLASSPAQRPASADAVYRELRALSDEVQP